ncbi:MAG: SDR family NAD(P)-dependent oxidoreductase, partial [Selenomonas sp.]|nr:SDR family NAD(P)-dependent oxidoreductase [Selenomonas sp.]
MTDKVVMISGGTSGIGLAAAREFLQAGAKVMLLGRSVKHGQEALAQLAAGERTSFQPCDVSRREDCQLAVDTVLKRWGQLDVLVNSAGVYCEGAIEDVSEAQLEEVLDINVKGT